MSHIVLVHGAWAGSWVWDTLLEPLRRAGHVPHPLALPGVGSWGADDVTLDDVAAVVADFGMLCDGIGLDAPVGISRWLEPTEDGRGTVVPPEAGAAVFFHEADSTDAIGAARRLVPQLETARLMAPTWTPERFGSLPRLYIEATLDRSVPLVTQREMQRLTPGAQVVSLESDHAPQLSARDDLAAALVEWCAERVRT